MQGAESGREEYHKIPTENPAETPSKIKVPKGRQELPLLFRAFRSDGRKFPIGSFTEMAATRKIRNLTGVIAVRVTMITPNNALIEFPLGSPVSELAQILHHIEEWEDFTVDTHYIMGDRKYILKVCQDRLDYEEQWRQIQMEEERRREEELERNDQLQLLIQQVNDQAKMVGELQVQNYQTHLQSAVGSESSGSSPRIPSSLHTPTGIYGVPATVSGGSIRTPMKSMKNPDLPIFSGELPTPKGEAEIDNYIFQLKLLQSSYTEDAIRNVIVATVRSHAKIAI